MKVVAFQCPCGTGERQRCPQRADTQARRFGRRAGFIDKDQIRRIEVGLGVEPVLPAYGDVWPLLLAGVCRFFESDLVAVEKVPDRARSKGGVTLLAKQRFIWQLLGGWHGVAAE